MKLPYKMRERWRSIVCKLQEKRSNRATLMDLVKFLEKQVRISTDPVFGNIQDQTIDRAKSKVKLPLKLKATGSFATNTDTIEPKFTSKIPNQSQGLYLFCNRGGHTLESCYALKKRPHRDKIDSLKGKRNMFWLSYERTYE
ncbi:hypothetical protein N1851_000292 [Merluccius polli]|uniref:Uncharacterized protein n=1 Tax=Merluccius polli TaxID=89951 RepID=A0AA47P9W1_MERPO|nr:hypothetical protein N1851_000292 [Merluccius polli]